MSKIEIKDVTKEFDGENQRIVAVDDFNIEIQDGEFVVLVGPSGCGKTTTLRCIAGLESVTEGNILFGNSDVTDLRARDRDVAMVFQNYALYPHMSVRENMSFGLKLSTDMATDEIDSKIESAAKMMGISDLLNKKPADLSGGQQQRVALGRAIVREPEVFLMDEPLSNLDAKLRAEMRTEIQALQQELNVTTVYVTHDQTEAMAMGDRIAVMNDGKLQQVGVPEELYRHPTNEFVANFIGSPSINLFDATVKGNTLIGPGDFTYELSDSEPISDQDKVRLGIRPEDIELKTGNNTLNISVVENMGNENILYADLGNQEIISRASPEVRPNPNENIRFDFPEEALYLFDDASGNALKTKTEGLEIEDFDISI